MAIFRYEAADASGKVLRGAMDAASAQEVSQRLTERGYRSVQVQSNAPATAAAGVSPQQRFQAAAAAVPASGGIDFGAAVRPEDLGLFFRQLASLANSGFTPATAFADLGPRTQNRRLRAASQAIAQETAAGGSLAEAMAKHTGVFPPHVIGLVQAGETGGFLPFAFEEAALGAEQDAALRQGLWVVKLLWWQSIWSVVLGQPIFLNLQRMLGGGLAGIAAATRDLFLIWIPIGIGLHVLAWLLGWMWRQPFAAPFRSRFSLATPVMAHLARMRALASFTRVLRRLLMSGISPEPAFVGAARAVPNTALRDKLLLGAAMLRNGNGIDTAIQATGLMGHDPLQLLITGQKTGQWLEMLDQVTAYYQEEAARATEAAKTAMKRWAGLATIVSGGYVLCAATYYGYKAMFGFVEEFAN